MIYQPPQGLWDSQIIGGKIAGATPVSFRSSK
jgi:hypothetical protein